MTFCKVWLTKSFRTSAWIKKETLTTFNERLFYNLTINESDSGINEYIQKHRLIWDMKVFFYWEKSLRFLWRLIFLLLSNG